MPPLHEEGSPTRDGLVPVPQTPEEFENLKERLRTSLDAQGATYLALVDQEFEIRGLMFAMASYQHPASGPGPA